MRRLVVTLVGLGALVLPGQAAATSPGANGRIVYQTGFSPGSSLRTILSNGTGDGPLPSTTDGTHPSLSADGSRYAFSTVSFGGFSFNHSVTVADFPSGANPVVVDSGTEVILPPNSSAVTVAQPALSPDGKRIAYIRTTDPDGIGGVLPTLETIVRPVASSAGQFVIPSVSSPSFSPNGRALAVEQNQNILLTDATASGPLLPLATQPGEAESSPEFSPDCKSVVYAADSSLKVIPTTGGTGTPVFTNPANTSPIDPSFSPDGSLIAFARPNNPPGDPTIDLFVVPAAGGTQTNLTDPAGVATGGGVPAWETLSPSRQACPEGVIPPGGGSPIGGIDDFVPPNTSFGKKSKKKIKTRRVKFTFESSEEGSTFTCQVDKKAAKPCTSPRRVKLKPRRHTFRVFATDAAGNADPEPAKARFRILKD